MAYCGLTENCLEVKCVVIWGEAGNLATLPRKTKIPQPVASE